MRDGEVQMLIECKKSTEPLKIENASQLYRHFAVTNARIAVLTNGEIYEFYTDLDAPNQMDDKPFLVLDLLDIDESLLLELRKLAKDVFDLDSIINAAGELKYIGQIKRTIAAQFKEPEDERIRFFTTRVYEGTFTQRVRLQFTALVTKATKQFLNDPVNERLKLALGSNNFSAVEEGKKEEAVTSHVAVQNDLVRDTEVETTPEELEGYQIIKVIACSEVKPQRVVLRDSKTYFAILLDDNNRKPIARLHFNGKAKKFLGLFDSNKVETRHEINSVDDIYHYAEHIRETVKVFA